MMCLEKLLQFIRLGILVLVQPASILKNSDEGICLPGHRQINTPAGVQNIRLYTCVQDASLPSRTPREAEIESPLAQMPLIPASSIMRGMNKYVRIPTKKMINIV